MILYLIKSPLKAELDLYFTLELLREDDVTFY